MNTRRKLSMKPKWKARVRKPREAVFYYTGITPLVIISKWHADNFGGPGIADTTYLLTRGQGIDLRMLGLVPKREWAEQEKRK